MPEKNIAIPSILKVSKGTLKDVGEYLAGDGLMNAVVYFGNGLIDLFSDTVMTSLKEAGVSVLEYCELDSVNIDDIIDLAFGINSHAQVILGIGGGKVIDAAKYAAYLRKLPFFSIPTSSSSDGFSSSRASLLIDGKRYSVPAKMAYGIIVDTDVIKSAPDKFIYSGIGDMVSKITAIYDWQFEVANGVGSMVDSAVMVAKKAVNSFVRTPYEDIHDDIFLRELLDSLAMSGIANEIAGGSLPTSGSALDKILEVPGLHGIQVGIATYIMAVVQDHRYERIDKVFTDTGFWDYVMTLDMKREDFIKAIDMAPSIKPHRYTFLHVEKYREAAKALLSTDEKLSRVLK